ncbi:MAG: NAD(P)H-binding protein [Bacteroidetes bacterium]|nr:NAD(P)H-binding protein [Bacteroidota bacterium]
MKVFVTGATGLIGNHLVKELLANGDEVKVFVRKTSNLEILSGYNVEFAFGDINSEEELTKAAKAAHLFIILPEFLRIGVMMKNIYSRSKAIHGKCNSCSSNKSYKQSCFYFFICYTWGK